MIGRLLRRRTWDDGYHTGRQIGYMAGFQAGVRMTRDLDRIRTNENTTRHGQALTFAGVEPVRQLRAVPPPETPA